MKLETHAKIGIWVAIISLVIGMSFFTLHESQSLKYEYGRLFVDENEMYEKLTSTGTISAFTEKFPYFYEDYNIRRDGSARLDVFAMNNQTGNRLELSIRYDQDDDRLRERINCNFSRGFEQQMQSSFAIDLDSSVYSAPFLLEGQARDQFVKDFIKYTTCLDDLPTKVSTPEPVPAMLKCGLGTTFVDGLCLVN